MQGSCASLPAATVMLKIGETKEGRPFRDEEDDGIDDDDVRENADVGDKAVAVPAVAWKTIEARNRQ